jgi:hypothetical protein
MPRQLRITIIVAVVGVAMGALYVRVLEKRIRGLRAEKEAEEVQLHQLAQMAIVRPTDQPRKVKLFYLSAAGATALAPREIEMPVAKEPVRLAKQIVAALIVGPPDPSLRTLPAGALVREVFLLSDGSALVDLSQGFAHGTPSGIETEQLAIDSIVQSLGANVQEIRRVKFLIEGQEVETLAGHVDLGCFYDVPRALAGGERATTPPSDSQ